MGEGKGVEGGNDVEDAPGEGVDVAVELDCGDCSVGGSVGGIEESVGIADTEGVGESDKAGVDVVELGAGVAGPLSPIIGK